MFFHMTSQKNHPVAISNLTHVLPSPLVIIHFLALEHEAAAPRLAVRARLEEEGVGGAGL